MIVADTHLVAYLFIEGERTGAARRVWERDGEWVLPPLWRSEFLNVLTLSVRAEGITAVAAQNLWLRATALLARGERGPSGSRVLETALRLEISAYDAHFVSLAEDGDLELVAGDKGLLNAFDGAVSIEQFAAQ